MPNILVKRRVFWTVQNAKGEAVPNKITKFEIIKDLFADGIVIPQEVVEVVSSNVAGHVGECECELYTVRFADPVSGATVDAALNYRVVLHNKNTHRFALAPGSPVLLDTLLNVSAIAEPLPPALELAAVIDSIAQAAVAEHENKEFPHPQYETEDLLLIYQTAKLN